MSSSTSDTAFGFSVNDSTSSCRFSPSQIRPQSSDGVGSMMAARWSVEGKATSLYYSLSLSPSLLLGWVLAAAVLHCSP